jgi:DNA primase small subunit
MTIESGVSDDVSMKQEDRMDWGAVLKGDLDTALALFYRDHFPFEAFHRWLAYNDPISFSRREFSLTLANDIYIRFQSYTDCREMIEKICNQCPRKIDIGAIYTVKPSEKRFQVATFQPVERELIIDIDLTDYDSVRTCCHDKKICEACWRFVVMAVNVIDDLLKYDFGFKHRLWVFSGRRGVHCWVADKRARILSANARKALLSFIELVRGGEEQKKKVNLSLQDGTHHLHPSVERSLKYVEPIFLNNILYEQDILTSKEKYDQFLSLIPDDALSKQVEDSWTASLPSNGAERWSIFENELRNAISTNTNNHSGHHGMTSDRKKRQNTVSKTLFKLREELLLQFTYPRLDANVSIQLNHLLKSPFCVHPDTGKVCVPFIAKDVHLFNPNNVPTVYDIVNGSASLAPALGILENFVAGVLQEHDEIRASRQGKLPSHIML